MSLTGTLESFQLGSLLQLLSNDQKTGVLRIHDGGNEASIFLKDGIIVYASSSNKEHQLGRLLISQGALSESGLKKCLQLAKEKGEKIGKTLMEEGYVSLETLKGILHHQVKEILCSLFFWKSGHFEFIDEPLTVDGKLVTRMKTLEIILEASRRIDELSFIKSEFSDDGLVFRISGKNPQKEDVHLNKKEWRILSLIDGARTVKQILEKSDTDEYNALKALCSLQLSGLIERCKAPSVEASTEEIDYSTVATIYNDVLQVIQQGIEKELGQRFYVLFDDCKAQLLPDQQKIFKPFDLNRPPGENIQAVVAAMERFGDLEKGRAFLIHSFTTLLQLILEKEKEALGFHLTQKTLDEIAQTLSYVRGYHRATPETERILMAIKTVLDDTGKASKESKEKPGGVLGLFRGR